MAEGDAVEQHSEPVFRRLLSLLGPHKKLVVPGLALLILSVPLELVPGAAALYIVDDIVLPFTTGDAQPGDKHPWLHAAVSLGGSVTGWKGLLVSLTIWTVALTLLSVALKAASTNLMERATQKMIFRLRNDLYDKLQDQSVGYLYQQRTGDLMSRSIGDVDQVQQFVVNGVDQFLAEGLIWIAAVVTVFFIDWRVASWTVGPILLVYLLLKLFNRKARPIYKAARESAGRVSTRLQENLGGLLTIKIFGREPAESRRFRAETQANYNDNIRAVNMRTIYFPLTEVLAGVAGICMYVSGAVFVILGSFTLGGMLAFRAFYWRLFGPIFTLARVNDLIQRSGAAARRIFEVLDETADVRDPDSPKPLPGRVAGNLHLDNVTFAYRNKPEPVLHEVTIDIPAGRTVALCGPSGAGKSTVLSLLLRFYDPTSGRVLLDNVDVRDVNRSELRRRMALVQQETFLFAETIADNIRYGRQDASLDDVRAAAEAANVADFIDSLPKGFDTMVGERGVLLSGGQKQRISLARAFLASPDVLLLDEPTSSVEPASEAAILQSILALLGGRTTVVTSHRPSLIDAADLVYVIEQGRVTASGSPREVRQSSDWFGTFMQSQPDLAASDRSSNEASDQSPV